MGMALSNMTISVVKKKTLMYFPRPKNYGSGSNKQNILLTKTRRPESYHLAIIFPENRLATIRK